MPSLGIWSHRLKETIFCHCCSAAAAMLGVRSDSDPPTCISTLMAVAAEPAWFWGAGHMPAAAPHVASTAKHQVKALMPSSHPIATPRRTQRWGRRACTAHRVVLNSQPQRNESSDTSPQAQCTPCLLAIRLLPVGIATQQGLQQGHLSRPRAQLLPSARERCIAHAPSRLKPAPNNPQTCRAAAFASLDEESLMRASQAEQKRPAPPVLPPVRHYFCSIPHLLLLFPASLL